ncbi:hypothetical protein [Nostoc sp.]|uniref:hypothetical protein n=1 Tax=Nostoc sp. TaxID=1180 RepID=UPI002FFC523A
MNTFMGKNTVRYLILLFIGFSVIVAIFWKFSPLFTSYQETKIFQKDLNGICNSKAYIDKAKQEVSNLEKFNPEPVIELKLKSNIPQIYEVFRWTCEYTFNARKSGGARLNPIEIGLELDEYCQNRPKPMLTKSTYHHYNDEDSWYCVNPNS